MPITHNVYRNTLLVFYFFSFFNSFTAKAQTPVYKNYTVTDGVPGQTVYCVMQDRKGYLWVSTDAGVSRFDGIHFKNFTTNDGLTDNEVFHIFEDSKGRLWFITFNGKPCYLFNGKFYNQGNDSTLSKIKNSAPLHSFYEDNENTIWLGTFKAGAIFIKENGEVGLVETPMEGNSPVYVYKPDKKRLWIISYGVFFEYREGKLTRLNLPEVLVLNGRAFRHLSNGKAMYISARGIELLEGDSNRLVSDSIGIDIFEGLELSYDKYQDNIWLTTDKEGALLMQKGDDGIYHITRKLFREKKIMSIYGDNENNTWLVSAGNGIFRISAVNFNLQSYTEQDGLEPAPLNCLYVDRNMNKWLGFNNGMVNCIKKDGTIIKINCALNMARANRVLALETDSQNNIWVGTDYGLSRFKALPGNNFAQPEFIKMNGLNDYSFKSIAKDRQGKLFLTYSNGIGESVNVNGKIEFIFSPKHIPGLRTYMHFYDHENNLWISNITGLCLYKNDSLISYGLQDPALSQRVFTIGETMDSTLVLGTYGFGVLFFKNGKVINRFSESGGLAGNICKKIFIKNDSVYIASVGGLTRFVYRNNIISSIARFTVSDGLLSDVVNDIMVVDGNMYVGSSQGLNIIPCDFMSTQSIPPPVYITLIEVNGQMADTTKKINLDYDRQFLRFNFIAPVFDRPENVVYSYTISKKDPNWVETKNNTVEFTSLAPGEYHFGVKARKGNSSWSEPAWLNFEITPPFWATTWFRVTSVLLTAMGIYLVFYLRIARVKKKAYEKAALDRKIAGLEMKALRAQMNPHFTFNVMNSIQNYIVNHDTTSALRYLSKFAKLIRSILENSQSPVIKLSEEINALEIYLDLEKLRFKNKFEYEIIIGSGIDLQQIEIPSMLMQTYIENAIKHGIMHKPGKGKVSVMISRNNDLVSCIIEDDGIGRSRSEEMKEADPERHISRGSQIASHRVEAFNISNNSNVRVSVEDLLNQDDQGTGTRVVIDIPIQNKNI